MDSFLSLTPDSFMAGNITRIPQNSYKNNGYLDWHEY
ncbi:hypothetical protein AFE_1863 [Acidithiobacillus ferrooxidans ATCC 23270]|uniref:Uncharacterized protein n=1 Tax=Acidithiobacillus ferrooxidans (strain ATCC 23270 / DSM 14882 / CIP 104768 / NCIMB 8455) TaxID=243159 RepID=B7JBW6_ACIF2|nr:hypothetical protein AFE_1863 [Acidithiobacillus ferrooxidans ATCC 23270]EGQ63940.1 hypothetical protein GGI1_22514 [Acidithiobacillus sp. GGI-221]